MRMSDCDENTRILALRVSANPNWNSKRRKEKPRIAISTVDSTADSRRTRRPPKHGNKTKMEHDTVPSPNRNIQSCRPLVKTSKGGYICILFCLFFERIAFYGLAGNLVLFLNKAPFFWVSYHAQSTLLFFFGVAFLMAPLGGWIADSYTGRFKTIVGSFIVYLGGYTLLLFLSLDEDDDTEVPKTSIFFIPKDLPKTCGSCQNETFQPNDSPFEERCSWLVYLILVFIAMGNGFAKANLGPLGSDQLSAESTSTQLSFFNWYYWFGNMGAFVGLGVMAYIEQQITFNKGYIVCAVCLAVGIAVFVTGRVFYTVLPPTGSVIRLIFKIIREARARKKQHNNSQNGLENKTKQGYSAFPQDFDNPPTPGPRLRFLDFAKRQHGGTFQSSAVNDVRTLKIILAVFAALIPYWLVYYQMLTTFLFQGLHMKLTFSHMHPEMSVNKSLPAVYTNGTMSNNEPELVAAWFALFDPLFLIILLPLFDRIIYPRLSRAGYPFTFTKRVVVGMLFSVSAMIVAGVVENYRLKAFWPHDDQPCLNASLPQFIGNSKYDAANMSVLWQIPQYALIGISEVFVSVSSLQFAVSVSPKSMKALITGIYYTSCGLGSLLGTLLLYIFSQSGVWFFKDNFGNISCRIPCSEDEPYVKSSCHLDYYFYFLGGLESAAILVFIYVSYRFGLNTEHPLTHNTPTRGSADQSGHVVATVTP